MGVWHKGIVRERAKRIIDLLEDESKLRFEQEKAKKIAENLRNISGSLSHIGSDPFFSGGGGTIHFGPVKELERKEEAKTGVRRLSKEDEEFYHGGRRRYSREQEEPKSAKSAQEKEEEDLSNFVVRPNTKYSLTFKAPQKPEESQEEEHEAEPNDDLLETYLTPMDQKEKNQKESSTLTQNNQDLLELDFDFSGSNALFEPKPTPLNNNSIVSDWGKPPSNNSATPGQDLAAFWETDKANWEGQPKISNWTQSSQSRAPETNKPPGQGPMMSFDKFKSVKVGPETQSAHSQAQNIQMSQPNTAQNQKTESLGHGQSAMFSKFALKEKEKKAEEKEAEARYVRYSDKEKSLVDMELFEEEAMNIKKAKMGETEMEKKKEEDEINSLYYDIKLF